MVQSLMRNQRKTPMADQLPQSDDVERSAKQKAKSERMKRLYAKVFGGHLIHFSPEEEASLTTYGKSEERLRMEQQLKQKPVDRKDGDDRLGGIHSSRNPDIRRRRLYHYGRTSGAGGDGLVRYDAVLRGENVAGAAGRAPAKVTKKVQARVREQHYAAFVDSRHRGRRARLRRRTG